MGVLECHGGSAIVIAGGAPLSRSASNPVARGIEVPVMIRLGEANLADPNDQLLE